MHSRQVVCSILLVLSQGLQYEPKCLDGGAIDHPTFRREPLHCFLGQTGRLSREKDKLYDGPWTNWYKDIPPMGLAKLSVIKEFMDEHAIHGTYFPESPVGGSRASLINCSSTVKYRTADGSCNSLDEPLMGAAGTRFGRNVPLSQVNTSEHSILYPNPREISRKVLHRRQTDGSYKSTDIINLLAAAWTQFQIHDWFSHGPPDFESSPIQIPLSTDDPLHLKHGVRLLNITRSTQDPSRTVEESTKLPKTFVNKVSHWWDGSQIYGSDIETQRRLRTLRGGRMKITGDGFLPVRTNSESTMGEEMSDTGLFENWWLGLETLTTLFVLEHNALADMLATKHQSWDDERIFQTARLVNTALVAKIHTLEWTPAILPNPTLDMAMKTNWNGLNQFLDPQYETPDADTTMFGIVGNKGREDKKILFMTEEFVSSYRMHPFLPETLLIQSVNGSMTKRIPTETTRDANARKIIRQIGPGDIIYSLCRQKAGSLTLENYPNFLQDLAVRTPSGSSMIFDVATIDIIRDRERGVPRFNAARRLLGLKAFSSFRELTGDSRLADKLNEVYDGNIEMLDFMVGMFAEGQRPTCFGFSETAFQIFILMASRRFEADRFFTDDFKDEVYTNEGLKWIQEGSMKKVLLRHYPELNETELQFVENAFVPWMKLRDNGKTWSLSNIFSYVGDEDVGSYFFTEGDLAAEILEMVFLGIFSLVGLFWVLHHILLKCFQAYNQANESNKYLLLNWFSMSVVLIGSSVPQIYLVLNTLYGPNFADYLQNHYRALYFFIFLHAVAYTVEICARLIFNFNRIALMIHHIQLLVLVLLAVQYRSIFLIKLGLLLDVFVIFELGLYVALFVRRVTDNLIVTSYVLIIGNALFTLTRPIQIFLLIHYLGGSAPRMLTESVTKKGLYAYGAFCSVILCILQLQTTYIHFQLFRKCKEANKSTKSTKSGNTTSKDPCVFGSQSTIKMLEDNKQKTPR